MTVENAAIWSLAELYLMRVHACLCGTTRLSGVIVQESRQWPCGL